MNKLPPIHLNQGEGHPQCKHFYTDSRLIRFPRKDLLG